MGGVKVTLNMSSSREKAASSRVLHFLCEWDRGSKSTRTRMLQKFLQENSGKTCPELELEFNQASSLFLTRITTWIRLTYMFSTCLHLQLRALGVVAECMVKSDSVETQNTASRLLQSLAHGNPTYQQHVYNTLVSLLTHNSPTTTQLTLHTLHTVQVVVKTPHPAIVKPLVNFLSSFQLEVQYEAIELIRYLQQTEVRDDLLSALIALLKPTKVLQDPVMERMNDSLPIFIQQAAAAKALRILAMESHETSEELVRLGIVHHLLYAMGNQEHADAQRQASLTLVHFVRSYPLVEKHVCRAMGPALFHLFMHDAELLYMNMDGVQADILLSNKVDLSKEFEEQNTNS
ncbi:hypothetical protein KOW79_004625 [Hemibagrus wyckioides]|uniref:Uncharacterized protein n=1 Tax=Hemibagrus wyckioides TaxID=337641 RepID=A0A9D3P295_9TELE|nr:hypothetical protein KOW79_004625 [Hemibagrus wyckioides]